MKYQGRGVYKNTDIGDVLATDSEANEAISHGHFIEIGRGEDSYFVIETQNAEAHASASASDGLTGSIPDEVRLWIAKVRDRLEHIHRSPITQKDGHALLRESIDIAQRYNCYESNSRNTEEQLVVCPFVTAGDCHVAEQCGHC
jgi:hypothetical protein